MSAAFIAVIIIVVVVIAGAFWSCRWAERRHHVGVIGQITIVAVWIAGGTLLAARPVELVWDKLIAKPSEEASEPGSVRPAPIPQSQIPTAGPSSPGISASSPTAEPSLFPSSSAVQSLRTEGWYELTAYRAVAFGNGHYSVDSITIGTESYPSSIRGSYSSSASDPNNFRTWLVGGKCSQLSVWVGKDQSSPQSAGTGRFVIKNGDIEIRAAEATMNDAAKHLEVDIKGVSRLTLLDTRKRLDANNAWGNPRVLCTEPPGEAR